MKILQCELVLHSNLSSTLHGLTRDNRIILKDDLKLKLESEQIMNRNINPSLLSNLLIRHFCLSIISEPCQLSASIILIVNIICDILKILQVRSHNHIAKSNKITMLEIFNCNWKEMKLLMQDARDINFRHTFSNSPRIFSSSNFLSINLNNCIRSNNSKWNSRA